MTRHQRRMESLVQGLGPFTTAVANLGQAMEAAHEAEKRKDRERVLATNGEAGGARTSEPSSSLANMSAEAGGSKVSRSRSGQGWYHPVAREHFCFPPRAYPQPLRADDQPIGSKSRWQCRCGAQWQAEGSIVLGEDPVGVGRNDYTLGVLRWKYLGGGNPEMADYLQHQDEMYDFRPLGPYYVRLLRLPITTQGGDWRDFGD